MTTTRLGRKRRLRCVRGVRSGLGLPGPTCLTNGPREGVEIVVRRPHLFVVLLDMDHIPAARRCEGLGVCGAEVIAMGLGVRGQLPDNHGRVRIHVRERCRRRTRARRLGALPGHDHTTTVPADFALPEPPRRAADARVAL